MESHDTTIPGPVGEKITPTGIDLTSFFAEFQDYLAPKLDTYEQAIYLYIFRHSRLIGQDEGVIGFKSARVRMACGIGEHGKPMSENSAYKKLDSLARKGCLEVLDSERFGRRIRLRLPNEIQGIVPVHLDDSPISLEDVDFFTDTINRKAILLREGSNCFYCLRRLTDSNYVIEHVISRPVGSNSYRNVVAACRTCNNRKNDGSAADFLRILFREGILSDSELPAQLKRLEALRAGELKPLIDPGGV